VTESLPFENLYRHGFARVAACTIPVSIADPASNARSVLDAAREAHDAGAAVAVFPELCLTGYAIDDLVMQDPVLDAVRAAIAEIAEASRDLMPLLLVGAPLQIGTRLYNCAVAISRGRVIGVAPKSYLPTYREFYERRWYSPGTEAPSTVVLAGEEVPVGTALLYEAADVPGLVVHAEVCEDLWVASPPSGRAALAGATVLANLSGSPITIARADDRRLLVQSQSLRCLAAYVYAAAGQGESTNDVSWDGQTMIYEGGQFLAETERFPEGPRTAFADVDLDRLRQDRLRQGTFDDNRIATEPVVRRIPFEVAPPASDLGLRRPLDRFPFVPDDPARLDQDCYEAFNIQVSALEQRMRSMGSSKPVIGVSGGLDSTHALLVVARAMDRMGRPRSDILAYTMPGFATSENTKSNAIALAEAIGATVETIDIRPMALELLKGIGHPAAEGEAVYDVTFENVQAGARTDFLFRLANRNGGFVVGTSDLSELALGWATYGVGDQMSHYAVNAGVPKTLIQHVIRWVISHRSSSSSATDLSDEAVAVLQAVLDTEISPELVPAGEDGKVQSTQDTIGPYSLHDFTLFHVLRFGFRPSKIVFLAEQAWADAEAGDWPPGFPAEDRYAYDRETIVRWMQVFLKRFFGFAQFKRTAIPNGPKVLPAGSLSPRGDWRAPSDGTAATWLAELRTAFPDLVD
jgi:NAD+ synthase (glutamine-hydrolysing)